MWATPRITRDALIVCYIQSILNHFLNPRNCICPSVPPFIFLPVYRFTRVIHHDLSICPSTRMPLYSSVLFTCLFIPLSLYLLIHLFNLHMCVRLFVCLSPRPTLCLFTLLPVYLSLRLFTFSSVYYILVDSLLVSLKDLSCQRNVEGLNSTIWMIIVI